LLDSGVFGLKEKNIVIKEVLSGSIAEEAGIEQGDTLISINGERIKDVFDYRFLIASEELLIEVLKADGETWEIEIEKDEYEDIGIEFESSMLDEAKSCTNNCIFCFIDQLPKGMRETLYFKDDDSRLSFLTGNYVTLTNMKEDDIDRIIKYRMSPINISVHTTNPELRVFMLKNKFAGNILDRIKKLTDAGIVINCQIVLCRGINDGEELDRSIRDLTELYPGVRSISIVPVGITVHREGLEFLEPFDSESSANVIFQVEKWQEKMLKSSGSRVVYLADEFYIMSERDIPDFNHYEDFPQIENGVGLMALLNHEFNERLKELDILTTSPIANNMLHVTEGARKISIATGVSSYKYINKLCDTLKNKFKSVEINIFDIKNRYFGENVTVTGLLTGSDIISQLKGKELGDELLICRCMLRAGEEVLLDDYSVNDIERELNIKVGIVENEGADLVNRILGISYE
jgi:putative radical SAM enzyme (TIGR03279 family)